MASSITLRSLLRRLPKSTVVPCALAHRYSSSTIVSSSGYRTDTAADCIAEFQGPVGHFAVNPLRTALYSFMDTIYPYTPTKNLRWSLNMMNHLQSPLAYIKSSLLGSGLDVTETAKTLHIFRDMRGAEQDVKVWVEEGTKLTEFGAVWVENANFVSKEGPKVFGHLFERNVYETESLWRVFLNPSVTDSMKPEELKRYEGKDCCEPCTPRNGLPRNFYKAIFVILIVIGTGIAGYVKYIHGMSFWADQARLDQVIIFNKDKKVYCTKINVGRDGTTTMVFSLDPTEAPVAKEVAKDEQYQD